jgi:hypothetical protein
MVDTAAEFRHDPGREPNWQENYMFLGWDEERRIATYLHLCHQPGRGLLDVKALVGMDGQVVSCDLEHSGDDCLAAQGLTVDVTVPLERWRLRYDGRGTRGPAGTWTAGVGDVPFGFDLDLHGRSPAVDWTPLVGLVDFPERVAKTHYEQGMKLTGRVWVGDSGSPVDGLLIRDHTWGFREFDFDLGFWTPMVFGESEHFVCGSSILLHGRWVGLLMHTDAAGDVRVAAEHIARANGPLEPGRYDRASVYSFADGREPERFDFAGRLTIPVPYQSLATGGKLMTDLYSRVTFRNEVGFGTFQWA